MVAYFYLPICVFIYCYHNGGMWLSSGVRGSHLYVHVEAFATGIKIESSDQSPLGANQGIKVTSKQLKSRTCGCNLTFDP